MRHDPFEALEGHFASQERQPSADFQRRVSGLLDDELKGTDFTPVVTGLRRGLPLAATIVLGVLTPSVSPDDVRALAASIEQSQASSVPAEPENPWQK